MCLLPRGLAALAVCVLIACDSPAPTSPADTGAIPSAVSAAPVAPSDLGVVALSTSAIELRWTDNSINETGFEIQRSTTAAGGAFTRLTTTGAGTTTYRDAMLAAGAEYCYEVRAFAGPKGHPSAYSAFSAVSCARTGAMGSPLPPTLVDVMPILSTRVDVLWTDNSTNETAFRVERSTDAGLTWDVAVTTYANAGAFPDESRVAEQRVCYRVFAIRDTLDSPASAVGCTTPPAAATGLTATVSGPYVDLAWRDNSQVEASYYVTRWATSRGQETLIADLPANSTSYRDTPTSGAVSYTYRVRPRSDGGGGTPSDTAIAYLIGDGRPSAPSNLVATQSPFSLAYARFEWTDNSTNEQGFRFERAPDVAGPWEAIEVFFPSYGGASVLQGFERHACYRARAYNSIGASDPSNVDCLALPATPSDVRATAVSASAIDVSWVDASQLETAYEIERFSSAIPGASVFIATGADVTSYRDTGLASDVTYTYHVRARTADGVSEFSGNAVASTSSVPPATPMGLQVAPSGYATVDPSAPMDVIWGENASNTDGYRLERSIDGGASWATVATTGRAEPYFYDAGADLQMEMEVCYRVSAVNIVGESPPSAPRCTAYPAQPTILSWIEVDGVADIRWTDNSNVEQYYEVREYALESGYNVLATLPANSTSWRGVVSPGQSRVVVAVRDGGPSWQGW